MTQSRPEVIEILGIAALAITVGVLVFMIWYVG
jgi:hypothetical protein